MVGTPLAFSSGLPFSGLVYIVYFVLVLAGLRAWWLDASPRGGTDHPVP
jgi:nicotinamide mononucleotide transporter